MIPFFNMTVYATMKVTPPDSTPYETGDRQECRLSLVGDSQHIDRDLTFKPEKGGIARIEFHEHPTERSCIACIDEMVVQSSETIELVANPSRT